MANGPTINGTDTLPPPTSTVSEQHFGNTPNTEISQDWLNGVDMEIRNVATANGAALSATDQTQMITAIKALDALEAAAREAADATLQSNINTKANLNGSYSQGFAANILNLQAADGSAGYASIYTDGSSANDFVIRTGPSSSYQYTTVDKTGKLQANSMNTGTLGASTIYTDGVSVSGSIYLTGTLTGAGSGGANFAGYVTGAGGTSGNEFVNFNQFQWNGGGNGYQKLPTGLIIQWGAATLAAGNDNIGVGFPITFPNAYLHGYACEANAVGTWGNTRPTIYGVSAQTTSQMQVWGFSWSGSNWSNSNQITFNWWAVGY